TRTEKDAIWKLYRGQFDIAPSEPMPEDTDWTGAEIRSCCRLSSLLDIPLSQAARNVVPVAVMATEQVERLRTWASGRCLSAASTGIYARSEGPKSGRRVQRGTSNN
ncbi:MAG: AAA family ATPase, partial [Planctomycetes bacterium]|nr:AAA family ATPase [Planctomycetota bacterium]